MDDPNMHAYGGEGPDDAEIGRRWREDSSLEKWFPLTAERLVALEAENAALKREAHTWWAAARDAAKAERARCVLYRWRDIRNDSPLLGDVMSQGARTRVQIGSATPLKYRTARTMHEAFGEGATLERERSNAEKLDAFIGRFCTAIVVAAMVALFVNAAFGGL